jgi:nicotinamide-nucleotide amidase
MKACILAIGSEMLGTSRLDTNSLKLTASLERHGIDLRRKVIVGDEQSEIAREIDIALGLSDLLIITGGLGPTDDDKTRESVAQALGLEMDVDQSIIDGIHKRFASRGMKMPKVNERQASVFRGQTTLYNSKGTAPGFHIEIKRDGAVKHVWIFPGVPHELEGMIAEYLEPWLERAGSGARYTRVLKIAGMSESAVEEKLAPFYQAHTGELVTILASQGQIEIHLQATGDEASARGELSSRECELVEAFGERLFGFDDDTLEAVVGRMLGERGETVSTAESCTGGLIASRLTDVPGSSAWFTSGAVCYNAQAKMFIAGVDPALIQQHGEVSEEVARDMAKGVRRRFHSTYGIGVTGIAGPGGGSEAKPVGTVHVAVADGKGRVEHRKLQYPFHRTMNKYFFSQAALDLLRVFLLRTNLNSERTADSGQRTADRG